MEWSEQLEAALTATRRADLQHGSTQRMCAAADAVTAGRSAGPHGQEPLTVSAIAGLCQRPSRGLAGDSSQVLLLAHRRQVAQRDDRVLVMMSPAMVAMAGMAGSQLQTWC